MRDRKLTPRQKTAFGYLGLLVGAAAIACSIGMIVTGKAFVGGYPNVTATPENVPSRFWGAVAIVFLSGLVTLVTGIRILTNKSDDGRP